MRSDWKLGAGILAVAGALALPASASAAISLNAPLAPCYQAVAPHGVPAIPVSLTGGTPGDDYQIVARYPGGMVGSAGSVDPKTPFDTDGDGAGTLVDVQPPGNANTPSAGRRIDLSVEDFHPDAPNGVYTTTALGSTLITKLAMSYATRPVDPARAREVAVSGVVFAHKRLYGFVTNRAGTRVLRRFFLGTGNVCGYARRRAVIAPPGAARGSYRLYINPGPKLDKPYSLSEVFTIYYTRV